MSLSDISPLIQSRLVKISVVEFTEDAPKTGTVRFTLPYDLRHSVANTIIAAGSRTVTLVDGYAELRMFTAWAGLVSDQRTRRGDPWAIWVHKSWTPHPYPIRVPIGNDPINLSEIEPYDWRAA